MKAATPRPFSQSAISVPSEAHTSCWWPPPGATMIAAPVAFSAGGRRTSIDGIVHVPDRVDPLPRLRVRRNGDLLLARPLQRGRARGPEVDHQRRGERGPGREGDAEQT